MVHGEFEPTGTYSGALLQAFRSAGIEVEANADYQVSLGTIIRLNSGEAVADDVFKAAD